jgi:hypothetical protein
MSSVENFLSISFSWLCSDENFYFTRQEYFTFFNRPGFSGEKNFLLTITSKVIMKFIWDSKQRFCLPTVAEKKHDRSGKKNIFLFTKTSGM